LSEEGEVLHIAPAAQKALGCHADVIGKNWIDLQGTADEAVQARAILSRALSGATHRFDVTVPAPLGTSLATFESYPIGHGAGRGVLLFLQKVLPAAQDAAAGDYDYEVEKTADGRFKLRSLQRWGHRASPTEGACFAVLHGRSSPCERCPVASIESVGSVQVTVRHCAEGDVEVMTARLQLEQLARVSARRLSKNIFSAMLQARLRELADRARLSKRERDVLDLLVDGRSFEEIGRALNITPRTVKFHQGKLLAKLGADSRSDLMRLLF
jgi:DNA-binding CsgD family transcriptional regulator